MTTRTGSAPAFTVLHPGPLTTVQDAGRPGYGALGVGPSGACDLGSYRLANRLVGNDEHAAACEITFGGLRIRAERTVTVCLTGARCPGAAHNAPVTLFPGDELHLGSPVTGLRTYLAVRGGVDARPVLGSRSTDLLAGLGPDPLAAGDRIAALPPRHAYPGVDVAPVPEPEGGPVTVSVGPGPRVDWFTGRAWHDLTGGPYTVTSSSDRTGLRLDGTPLRQCGARELPSEGLRRGAIQVPPAGAPILFLADHPVTGGYPIIAYVAHTDIDRCAQLQPGQAVRFAGTGHRSDAG
jgi:biotin-dependent carboxylase-like uncharacterized protein